MSIFKSTFNPEVINQIKKRQKAIGESTRTSQTIQYYNARNAWIRMTSGVDVNNDNGALAQNGVLLGGNTKFGSSLKSGIGNTNDSAYSTKSPGGGDHRLGIRPMPGITSLEVKSKSAYGSLREAIVSFQCWDIRQLEELEKLYMRPGYTVMVEWGWIPYLDNNKALQNNAAGRFNNRVIVGGVSKETIWKEIFDESEDGNYDAVYGFVRNYSWSARPDGGYDCTTTIITMGEVAESLKINYSAFDSNVKVYQNGLFNVPPPSGGGTRSIFSQLFGSLFNAGPSVAKPDTVRDAYSENIVAGICAELYYWAVLDTATPPPSPYSLLNRYDLAKYDIAANNKQGPTITNGNTQVYIKLGDFLKLLNDFVILQDENDSIVAVSAYESNHNGSSSNPLLCLADRRQISTNPFVCLIRNNAYLDPDNALKVTGLDIRALDPSQKGYYAALKESYIDVKTPPDENKCEFGIIANIYVNVDYIYGLVTTGELESKDKNEKNDINLYDFLKAMMDGINTTIGNVANFDIHIDPIDSVARIIDVHYVENKKKADAYTEVQKNKIQIGNTKSIVRNYRLESMIFPEQSTLIAIGAQAEGGALATNTNTLIDYNKGLTDRIVTKRIAPLNYDVNGKGVTNFNIRLAEVQNNYAVLAELFIELVPDWWDFGVGDYDIEQAAKYANALKDIISFFSTYTKNDNSNRAILPTKLSLEMDGIGGMIIGNMFSVNEDAIPEGYKGGTTGVKTGYIITGLAHSLRNNDWTTTVDAQFVVLDNPQTNRVEWKDIDTVAAVNVDLASVGTGILPPAPPPPAVASLLGFGLPLGSPTYFNSLLYRNTSKTVSQVYTTFPKPHWGLDLAGPNGSTRNTSLDSVVGGKGTSGDFVYAIQTGVVINANKPPLADIGGFGRWVVIKHTISGVNYVSVYGHLAPYSIKVKVGDTVSKGTPLAMVGNEGTSGGHHLHLELWKDLDYYPSLAQKGNVTFRNAHLCDPLDYLPWFDDLQGKITDNTINGGSVYNVI